MHSSTAFTDKMAGKCWLKITAPCNAYRNPLMASGDECGNSLKVYISTPFFGYFAVQENIYVLTWVNFVSSSVLPFFFFVKAAKHQHN